MREMINDELVAKNRKPAAKSTPKPAEKSYERSISTAGAGDPKQVKPVPKKKS